MAKWKRVRAGSLRSPQAQAGASAGFTLSNLGASTKVDIMDFMPIQRARFNVRSQTFATGGAAAKAFGIKVGVLPETELLILAAKYDIDLAMPSGVSGTAGEMGLGTVIGSGAVAALSGTSTFEDIATGQTLANSTANATTAHNHTAAGTTLVDATAGSVSCHLNFASTWSGNGTATISGNVDIWYVDLGDF